MQVMRLQNASVPSCGLTNTTNKSPLQVTGPATDRPESQAKVSAFRCDWLDNSIQTICLIFCKDLPFRGDCLILACDQAIQSHHPCLLAAGIRYF